VVDTSTPSCGDSRFGCWVCTLVEKDKSMSAMIQNDEEKEWMLPLLELRDALDVADDRHLRDFRRMNGKVQLFHDRPIPGPYTESSRHEWLRRLLDAQEWIRENGPDYVEDIELVTLEELHEIRRIWVFEKHEIEDALPRVYREVTGRDFPGPSLDDILVLRNEDLNLLREITDGDPLHYQLTRELLDVERKFRTMARRAGLFEAMEQAIKRNFYTDADDAVAYARRNQDPLGRLEDLDDSEDDVSVVALEFGD
jgi:DNA sulfur modification protein DndC